MYRDKAFSKITFIWRSGRKTIGRVIFHEDFAVTRFVYLGNERETETGCDETSVKLNKKLKARHNYDIHNV